MFVAPRTILKIRRCYLQIGMTLVKLRACADWSQSLLFSHMMRYLNSTPNNFVCNHKVEIFNIKASNLCITIAIIITTRANLTEVYLNIACGIYISFYVYFTNVYSNDQ